MNSSDWQGLIKWLGTLVISWIGIFMTVKHFAREISIKKNNFDKVASDLLQIGKDIEELRIKIEQNRGDVTGLKEQMNQLQGHYNTLINDLINRYKTRRNS